MKPINSTVALERMRASPPGQNQVSLTRVDAEAKSANK